MKDKNFWQIRKNALAGDVSAQYYLSLAYEDGFRVARSLELSFYWCMEAAKRNHPAAQFRLSNMYSIGKGLPKPDKDLALQWLSEAAKNGHTKAKHQLGKRFLFNNPHKNCCLEARQWFRSAAASGNAKSYYYLGFMHIYGIGCEKNPVRAFSYFKSGANLGNMDCEAALGTMYERGEGCFRNTGLSEYWYEKAAAKGHAGAQFALSILYLGAEKNKSAAIWASIAAHRGILPAQAIMAKFFAHGIGVQADVSEALMWCLIGLNSPFIDPDSLNIINECHSFVIEHASPRQFAQAHEKAKRWLEIQNSNDNGKIDWSSQVSWEISQFIKRSS